MVYRGQDAEKELVRGSSNMLVLFLMFMLRWGVGLHGAWNVVSCALACGAQLGAGLPVGELLVLG